MIYIREKRDTLLDLMKDVEKALYEVRQQYFGTPSVAVRWENLRCVEAGFILTKNEITNKEDEKHYVLIKDAAPANPILHQRIRTWVQDHECGNVEVRTSW